MSKLMNLIRFDRKDLVKCLFYLLIKVNFSSSSASISKSFFISRIFVVLWIPSFVHLDPNCKCVKFTANYTATNEGTFTSPDWPKPYDPGIDCLLYIFIGKPGQLIEISFNSFDVYSPSKTDCSKGDFIRLLLNPSNESLTLNELESSVNPLLCGNYLSDWKRHHYSFASLLIFQFHTSSNSLSSNGHYSGFSGIYRFLESSVYQPDGLHLPGSTCDYQFLSISSTDSNETTPMMGKFFSPFYPNRYPSSSHCAYHFMGKYNERVKIVFEKIIFANSDSSCLDTNDFILIYDGPDTESPLIGQLCNDDKFVEIISSGPDLHIIFNSGSKSSSKAKGFQALYSFNQTQHLRVNSLSSSASSSSHHYLNNLNQKQSQQRSHHSNRESDESKLSRDETLNSEKSFTCDQFFNSEISLNGSFHSPNYPDIYPEGVRCRYHFNGHGKQRVQIVFNEFDLFQSSPKSKSISCESSDTLMVLLTINGNKESLDNFCGSKKPVNLMSNGPNLLIEFRSGYNSKRKKVKGFKANYRFVTNFGINSGDQEPNRVCSFIFNSTKSPNGTINSPNFPGLYPRNTECQYFFHGKSSEQVHLNFLHFDIEGVPPCNADSSSDYIEFSNYQLADRKLSRHCGFRKPRSIISESQFFRLTFKSNNKFDGTGFEAYYSFRDARNESGARLLSSCVTKVKPGSWLTVITFIFIHTQKRLAHRIF